MIKIDKKIKQANEEALIELEDKIDTIIDDEKLDDETESLIHTLLFHATALIQQF